MANTDSNFTQGLAQNDFELFIDAFSFKDDSNQQQYQLGLNGSTQTLHGSNQTGNITANVTAALKRTGVFGSDPNGIVGYPPFASQQLPTLKNPSSTPPPKGFYLRSVDFIMWFNAGNTGPNNTYVAVYAVNFVNNQPVNKIYLYPATTLAPLGAVAANVFLIYPIQINSNFLITSDTELIVNMFKSLTAPGQMLFVGAVLKGAFNFN